MIREYVNDSKEFKKQLEKFNDVKNDIERLKMIENFQKTKQPAIKFQACYKINSEAHYNKYAQIDPSFKNIKFEARKQENLETLLFDELEDEINLLLFAGILFLFLNLFFTQGLEYLMSSEYPRKNIIKK